MKIKQVFFLVVLFCVPFFASGQQALMPEIKKNIAGFEKAIQQKDTSLLKGFVSDDFSVSTTTWPASGQLLTLVFGRSDEFEFVRLAKDKVAPISSKKYKVDVLIKEKGKEPIKSYVACDSEGKILYVDYIDQMFGRFRNRESRLRAKLPIEVQEEGSIIVDLKINDNTRTLRFLFDSGADGMAISKSLADSLGLKEGRTQSTSVVGGNMKIVVSTGNTVWLDTLKLADQNIAIFEKMRKGIDGIIGLGLAKSFITKVDFDQKALLLYDFGQYDYEKEGETLPIRVPAGIALLPASLDLVGKGYVDGNFAFDTGAAYNLIAFNPFVRKNRLLVSGFKPESQGSTTSLGHTSVVFHGKCEDFRLSHIHAKNMPVTLQASAATPGWDPGADGSIGIKLISRYNFTINLLDKEIHLTPNKRANMAW